MKNRLKMPKNGYGIVLKIILVVISTAFVISGILWGFEWLHSVSGLNFNLPDIGHETWVSFSGSILGGIIGIYGVYLSIQSTQQENVMQRKIAELDKLTNMHNTNLKAFNIPKLESLADTLLLEAKELNTDQLFAYIKGVNKELNDIDVEISIAESTTMLALNYSCNDENNIKYKEAFYELYNETLEIRKEIARISTELARQKMLADKEEKILAKMKELKVGSPERDELSKEHTKVCIEKLDVILPRIDWRKYNTQTFDYFKKLGLLLLKGKQDEVDELK